MGSNKSHRKKAGVARVALWRGLSHSSRNLEVSCWRHIGHYVSLGKREDGNLD